MATNMDGDKIDPITEKPIVSATVTSVNADSDPSALESDTAKPSRDLKQAIYAIVGGVALPCIPIIVVSAVLLYVIFKHRIVPREAKATTDNVTALIKEIRHQGGNAAYYVEYNPSTITTIASWTGRVIPYLSSSIMALVAFFAARHIVIKSKHGDHTQLPTPEQLTLLISLLGGSGFGPLKETALYRWGRKEKLVAPLPAAFAALGVITLLGLIIPIVDTWFGVATQPVTITQLYNTSTKAYHSYGRNLDPGTTDAAICPDGPGYQAGSGSSGQSWWWPCNLFTTIPHPANIFLQGAVAVADLQLYGTTNDMLSNYTGLLSSDSTQNQTMFFYADSRSSKTLDFKAQTLGISTQCIIATTSCGYIDTNETDYQAFKCSDGFGGDVSYCYPNVWPANASESGLGGCTTGIGYATDAQLSSAAPMVNFTDADGLSETEIQGFLQQNPTYFATWGIGFPALDSRLFLNGDAQVFPNSSSQATWILNCSSTVYDVTYTYVNGALHSFNATVAEPVWGAFFSAPFTWSWLGGLMPAKLSLENAAYFAGSKASTGAEMATLWAQEYSKAALQLSVGVFQPLTNDIEQIRNSTITVARIPLVPLYLLLGFKFIYVIVVILLAIGAYCFTHPAETEVVKAQLSVQGLAAAHFDQPDLVRKNVVQEVQSRLELAKNGGSSTSETPAGQPLKRAATEPAMGSAPAGEATEEPAKVGLMPTRAGTWKFVLLADGAWQSVKPIVQTLVLNEAKDGKFGAVGDAYAAWK
ncbi:hypothetical protein LTR10_017214 [Elasticomyces elasticus]|uniref:Uncharacterized protein n=1 Tax=Exophiala sideris TaxID=1016849 RepID=A0ABR0J5C1_9EURO|nr:hypothetical protein LTR10_017214 [Elasticomyces elasticus]KAK5028430.1 hypothetical protein LTS07_006521 [Exophiala sideris]KAK5035927.1 hypothetical protein LTR13_005497 [Exophiala sideris]KAK5056963.1 hypothetical protein LTR69_007601 [Exophiala sideris]KAK5181370.1 hypothetical protein LTR44_006165 [Eurotiomycetes sp. CCFEE 6388]